MPNGATFEEKDGAYVLKGPKGELAVPRLSGVQVKLEDNVLNVTLEGEEDRQSKANLGTNWSLLKNAAIGVTEGFTRNLEAWEMVDQVLAIRRDSPERPAWIRV